MTRTDRDELDLWQREAEGMIEHFVAEGRDIRPEVFFIKDGRFQGSVSAPAQTDFDDAHRTLRRMGAVPAAYGATSILATWTLQDSDIDSFRTHYFLRSSINGVLKFSKKQSIAIKDSKCEWQAEERLPPEEIPDAICALVDVWKSKRSKLDPRKVIPALEAEGYRLYGADSVDEKPIEVRKAVADVRWIVFPYREAEAMAIPIDAIPDVGPIKPLFELVNAFCDERSVRIAFFGEMTTWLYDRGTDWESLAVDWRHATGVIAALVEGQKVYDWLTFTPTQLTYPIMFGSHAESLTLYTPQGIETFTRPDIEQMLERIRTQLISDINK